MAEQAIHILKLDGEKELFDEERLKLSLRRAGAKDDVIDSIVKHIVGELQEGMSTAHIYKHAFSLLRKIEEQPVAARYSLRRAVFGLGPTGFPFEDYLSELFRARGYVVETGKILQGKCVEHEVDMLAYKDDEFIGAELKFHNSPGIKTDLKVALYVSSRFEDLKLGPQKEGESSFIERGMLVTNTRFTKNAIIFSECAGLSLLGWDYPDKGHLEDLIEGTGIYPITTLTSLSRNEKVNLLQSNIVVCNDLENNADGLEKAGVPSAKIGTVIGESQALCSPRDYIE
jgi:hypothetical protein